MKKIILIFMVCVFPLTADKLTDQAKHQGVTLNFYQSDDGSTIDFRILNADTTNYNLKIEMDLDNMKSDRPLPFQTVVPASTNTEMKLFSIQRVDMQKGFYYRNFKWYLTIGPSVATSSQSGEPKTVVHKGTYKYPFAKGQKFRVDNAFNGYGAHQGDWAYAVDFKMPEGTPIHAARAGVVIAVEDKYSVGGNDPSLGSKANFIFIEHQDGSMGRYLHFKKNGVLVKVGQKIKISQKIGLSGNTGWSTDPHLHFDVVVPGPGNSQHTVPFKFRGSDGKAFSPVFGMELQN